MPLGNFFLEVRESYSAVQGEHQIFDIHLDLQEQGILQILEIRISMLFYQLAYSGIQERRARYLLEQGEQIMDKLMNY